MLINIIYKITSIVANGLAFINALKWSFIRSDWQRKYFYLIFKQALGKKLFLLFFV